MEACALIPYVGRPMLRWDERFGGHRPAGSAPSVMSARPSPEGPPPEGAEDDSDAALVRAAIARDPRAAAELWTRHAPQVRRIVRRALGDVAEVEDLVQEVFLRVFRHVESLRKQESLHAFVLLCTSSVLASEFRRRKVRRFLGLSATGELPEQPVTGRNEEAREVLRRLHALLERAGHDERMAFLLRTVEGLQITDVASALGVSTGTVKRRLAKFQARLERACAEDAAFGTYLGRGATDREGES